MRCGDGGGFPCGELFLCGDPETDLSGVLVLNEPAAAAVTGDLMFEGNGGAGGGTTDVLPSSSTYNTCH